MIVHKTITVVLDVSDEYLEKYYPNLTQNQAMEQDLVWALEHSDYGSYGPYRVLNIEVNEAHSTTT